MYKFDAIDIEKQFESDFYKGIHLTDHCDRLSINSGNVHFIKKGCSVAFMKSIDYIIKIHKILSERRIYFNLSSL